MDLASGDGPNQSLVRTDDEPALVIDRLEHARYDLLSDSHHDIFA